MKPLHQFAFATLLSLSCVAIAPLASATDGPAAKTVKIATGTRVQLQAALQTHIDRTTVQGVYPKVDLKSGKVSALHPAAGHPMILSLGDYYVLCADFRDATGAPVNVDFYVAKRDRGFSIFQVEFANRAPLEALVKNGIATMLQ